MFTMATVIPNTQHKTLRKSSFFKLRQLTRPGKEGHQDDDTANSDQDASKKFNFPTTKNNPQQQTDQTLQTFDRVPEYVFVMLVEMFIVLIAALGCLFLVAGPSNTFPVAPAVMWVANLLTWIGSLFLCYFTSCVLNRTHANQVASNMDTTTQRNKKLDNSTKKPPLWKTFLTDFLHFLQLLFTQTVKFDTRAETMQVIVLSACSRSC